MAISQLLLENFIETTVATPTNISGTGDITFTLVNPLTYKKGFIVFSPSNAALREIMYFHDNTAGTISVKAENRALGGTSLSAHTSQEPVAMKDVAEIFNFFSNNISSAFYVEKMGGLNINVWGGNVFYNQVTQTFQDAAFTLTPSTTNYINYDYPTNTLSVALVSSFKTKAIVVTDATSITSITYQTTKESYVDFTVAINTALPPQAGNAGKSLITDGTNVSWGTNNNYRTGLGAALKNIEVDSSGNEVATAVTAGITISSTDTIRKRTVAGLYEDLPFSVVESTMSDTMILAAGEALTANDFIYEEEMNTFLATYTNTVPSAGQNIGDIAANTRVQLRLIGNGVSASSLKLPMNKAGTPGDNVTFRIEGDTAGSPSGVLVHANATASIAGGTVTAGASTEVTVNFAGAFSIPAGTVCHLVIARSGANDPANYYQTALYTRRVRGYTMSLYNASWGATITTSTLGVIYTGAYSSLACKTDASFAGTSIFDGFTSSSVAVGALATIQKNGNNKGESGLTPGAAYYLSSSTAGDISTTPGTVVRFVGFAKSATEIAILEKVNNLSLIDQPTANYVTVWSTTSVFKQWRAIAPCTVLVTVTTNPVLLLNQTAKTSGVAFNVEPGDIVSFYATGTQTLQVLNKVLQSGSFII